MNLINLYQKSLEKRERTERKLIKKYSKILLKRIKHRIKSGETDFTINIIYANVKTRVVNEVVKNINSQHPELHCGRVYTYYDSFSVSVKLKLERKDYER